MANFYSEGTGTLVFDGAPTISPIIRVLFGALDLDETFPGEGEVFIAWMSESHNTTWAEIVARLELSAAELGISIPVNADRGRLATWLDALFIRFGSNQSAVIDRRVFEDDSFDEESEDAGLEARFNIAMSCRDGHNLCGLKFELARRSDAAALRAFGGSGLYIGCGFKVSTDSSDALSLGANVEKALRSDDARSAGVFLAQYVDRLLTGVPEGQRRAEAMETAIEHITRAPASLDLGGKSYTAFVAAWSSHDHCDAPRWARFTLDQSFMDDVARHMSLVKELNLASLGMKRHPDWEGETRTDGDHLHIDDLGFHWVAKDYYDSFVSVRYESHGVDLQLLRSAIAEADASGVQVLRLSIDGDEVWKDCLLSLNDPSAPQV